MLALTPAVEPAEVKHQAPRRHRVAHAQTAFEAEATVCVDADDLASVPDLEGPTPRREIHHTALDPQPGAEELDLGEVEPTMEFVERKGAPIGIRILKRQTQIPRAEKPAASRFVEVAGARGGRQFVHRSRTRGWEGQVPFQSHNAMDRYSGHGAREEFIMNRRELRSPRERVGTLPNADLPPPDEDPPSAEALLRLALIERDEEAFRTVSQGLRPEMIRIATRYVRSKDDAEDVVQDTWLAALASVKRFEGRASLRTWLLRILSYRARTAGQKASRAVPVSQLRIGSADEGRDPFEALTPVFVTPPPGPDALLMSRELGTELDACLSGLPPRQREVLRLRDIEGRSAAWVCRAMGLTPVNQRVLLHRARQQVRLCMKDYLEPEEARKIVA